MTLIFQQKLFDIWIKIKNRSHFLLQVLRLVPVVGKVKNFLMLSSKFSFTQVAAIAIYFQPEGFCVPFYTDHGRVLHAEMCLSVCFFQLIMLSSNSGNLYYVAWHALRIFVPCPRAFNCIYILMLHQSCTHETKITTMHNHMPI